MSLAPRCPQCRVPMRVSRLCVVCETGVQVQRIEPRTQETMRPSGLLAMLQALADLEEEPPTAPVSPALPPPKERITTTETVTLSCETPGCPESATYNVDGLRRLRAKAHPARCLPCRQRRRKETLNEAWSRYKTKHFA